MKRVIYYILYYSILGTAVWAAMLRWEWLLMACLISGVFIILVKLENEL